MKHKNYRPLPRNFFSKPTLEIAKSLLGKYLFRDLNGQILSGMIVETEAYHEKNDPACHAHRGMTERNKVMFQSAGRLYVYFTYGMHYCMNIVTEDKGIGAAVLIRAVEPIDGIEIMSENRKHRNHNLCNGPARLCQAMKIDKNLNGMILDCDTVWIGKGIKISEEMIGVSERIGISAGKELLWRFFIKNNPAVTRYKARFNISGSLET
ncbi:MAG: DNA-3-methyladenine glycosylase [Spirochaetia bacterium]|nr:DNA-3-methyladenine glycosylase [Spirochaetia bacterium]